MHLTCWSHLQKSLLRRVELLTYNICCPQPTGQGRAAGAPAARRVAAAVCGQAVRPPPAAVAVQAGGRPQWCEMACVSYMLADKCPALSGSCVGRGGGSRLFVSTRACTLCRPLVFALVHFSTWAFRYSLFLLVLLRIISAFPPVLSLRVRGCCLVHSCTSSLLTFLPLTFLPTSQVCLGLPSLAAEPGHE